MAAGQLGHQVGSRGRDHDQIRFARQADVTDVEFVRGIEQVGEDLLAGNARRPTAA